MRTMINKAKFIFTVISLYLLATSSVLGINNEYKSKKIKIHLEPSIAEPINSDPVKRSVQLKEVPPPIHIEPDSKLKGLNIGAEGLHYTNKISSPTLIFAQPVDYTHSAASGLLNGYYVFPGETSDINFYAGAGAGLSFYKTMTAKEILENGKSLNPESKKGVDFAYQGFVGMEKRLTGSTGLDVKLKIMNLGNVKTPKTGKAFDGEASIGIKHNF